LDAVVQVDAVFDHGGFVWMVQTDVALVLLTLVSMERPVCPM
jgi:hypothetical protein